MTLRTRFALLVVGSAVVPPLMLGFALFLSFANGMPPDGAGGFMAIQRLRRTAHHGELSVQIVSRELQRSGMDYLIHILDSESRVLYPGAEAGEPVRIIDLLDTYEGEGNNTTTIMTLPDEDGGSGHLIFSYEPSKLFQQFAGIGFLTPVVFVLFTALMSVLIIRSINSSITNLETATRRVADGDLDFSLSTDGKDRIASLTRSFETMRAQLKEQYDRGSRFLMGLSHDLKTPLTSIAGYVDAIRDGYADSEEKLEKYMSIIQAKTWLLESRISSLIDYAKQETREWKSTLMKVDFLQFAEELLALAETEALARHFRFTHGLDVPPETVIEMDSDMVGRAFENLVENAFAYATPGSEISIRATSADGAIRLEFANEGSGIDPEHLPHIFDPLFRGSGDRHGGGFGLGLATVRSVITSHGWDIAVTSQPGGTTVFAVTIPLPASSTVSGPPGVSADTPERDDSPS